MKTGQVVKSAALADGELELINQYTRRELCTEDVFVFSVVLCDNDIDRDFERFTVESLEKLASLFVGKTGIFDHNPKAKNQSARIISCSVESVDGRKNSLGDDYFRLVARAYMPVSESNKALREMIDSGIVREVSVGCAVGETVCSICQNPISSHECAHIKGNEYDGKLCYGELCDPYDAYEWSFVAVPAQKHAGVIKTFGRKEVKMNDILKSIENSEAVTLTEKDSKRLKNYIEGLKKQAADGVMYRNSLASDVLKFSAIVQPEIPRETMERVTKNMSIDDLQKFREVYSKKLSEHLPVTPQLYMDRTEKKVDTNTEFKI
ncbi:MAG: hypothetical protein J1E96_07425 [Ruminococcus sp.]|nr:hypothetical protein [Ruminococcus sp.]